MKIEGILFDLDGTLVNTTDLIIKSFRHTLKEILNIEPTDKEITQYFGLPLPECLGNFNKDKVDEMLIHYRELNEKNHDELIRSFPYVEETLRKLKEQNIKTCVVTSKKVLWLREVFIALNWKGILMVL